MGVCGALGSAPLAACPWRVVAACPWKAPLAGPWLASGVVVVWSLLGLAKGLVRPDTVWDRPGVEGVDREGEIYMDLILNKS